MKNHNDDIILVATKDDYYFYYDNRHKQKFVVTPNHRVSRHFGHACGDELAAWANNQIKNYISNKEK